MKKKALTMTISLSETLRDELEDGRKRKAYSTTSEYVRELIRQGLKREAIERVDALLLEGLHSGPAKPITDDYWKELHRMIDRQPSSRHATKKPSARRRARSR